MLISKGMRNIHVSARLNEQLDRWSIVQDWESLAYKFYLKLWDILGNGWISREKSFDDWVQVHGNIQMSRKWVRIGQRR